MAKHYEFDKMIEEIKPDCVIVTSVERTHDWYIIRAMELGCDVITEKPMTMDAKTAGDYVYIIGDTKPELGGSEYFAMLNATGNNVPKLDAAKAIEIYTNVSNATEAELVHSLTTPALGGLAMAFGRSAMGGRMGCTIDLAKVPASEKMKSLELLFSESNSRFVATVAPADKEAFEKVLGNIPFACVGTVDDSDEIKFVNTDEGTCSVKLDTLIKNYKGTLDRI